MQISFAILAILLGACLILRQTLWIFRNTPGSFEGIIQQHVNSIINPQRLANKNAEKLPTSNVIISCGAQTASTLAYTHCHNLSRRGQSQLSLVATVAIVTAGTLQAIPISVRAQSCTTVTHVYDESFTNSTYRDPKTSAEGWGNNRGGLTVNGTVTPAFPTFAWGNNRSFKAFGERLVATAAADFDGDGFTDIVGISAYNGCHIEIFSNVTAGTFNLSNAYVVDNTCTSTTGAIIATGDVDNDGRKDFVVATTVADLSGAGTVRSVTLYRNTGSSGGKASFSATDVTSLLQADNVSWHKSGSQMVLLDWDQDGRDDLLFLSSAGNNSRVLLYVANPYYAAPGYTTPGKPLLSNAGLATPIATAGAAATGSGACLPGTGATSIGGTVLGIADFDGDGLLDIITGSASELALHYYLQNADGSMRQTVDIPFGAGGATFLYAYDMDNDSTPDLTVVRSGNDCGGPPGEAFIFANRRNQGGFVCQEAPLKGLGGNAVLSAILDINRDGGLDVLVGRSTGSGRYAQWLGGILTAPGGAGTALSKSVNDTSIATSGVVDVTVASISTNATINSTVAMYVTNNGGRKWDQLSRAETLSAQTHNFTTFGTDLRYRLVLSNGGMFVKHLTLNYNTVGSSYYTRSNVAEATIKTSTTPKDLIYSAGFNYPGFEGKLYAYDATNLSPGSATALQQVNPLVSTLYEAGSLLQNRSGSSRRLYTAYPTQGTGGSPNNWTPTARIGFNTSELNAPSSNPSLQQMMNLPEAQKITTMNFLTSGMNSVAGTKYYDPGHSSPVVVNPPSGDPNYLGNNYQSFVSANVNRKSVVLLGSNDGALHAFDALSGTELWGFIPYNLLSKMASQRVIDPNTGTYIYAHDIYVDGPIHVTDAYVNGTWKTLAVVSQAQGSGLGGNNFVFALDITDTNDPKPLWEFTEAGFSLVTTCDGNPCNNYSCANTYLYDTTSNGFCSNENVPYDSYFSVSKATPDSAGGASGLIEAEHYDDLQKGSPNNGNWALLTPTNSIFVAPPRGGSYMEAQGSAPCPSGSTAAEQACTFMTYRFKIASSAAGNYYPWLRMNPKVLQTSAALGFDGSYSQLIAPLVFPLIAPLLYTGWTWYAGSSVYLTAGDHTMTVWMNQVATDVDTIALQTTASASPSTAMAETPVLGCAYNCIAGACGNTCLANPNNQEWSQCGVGRGLKCCAYGTKNFCSPVNSPCSQPNSVMGQSFSRASIGKIQSTTGDRWVAFFASGYNNRNTVNVGRSVYAVDAYTGRPMGQWNFPDVPFNSSQSAPTIEATVPGSVTLVDANNDGYVDRLYVGDLAGRLWKINTFANITLGADGVMNSTQYPTCVLFDAGNAGGANSAVRGWAPIISKPAVAVLSGTTPNVYFGTGGDDSAPSTIQYKFYSIRDSDALTACSSLNRSESTFNINNLEWIIGDNKTNTSPQQTLSDPNSEGLPGEKFWSDPIIVNNNVIYFSSLPGQIEQVNPCLDAQGTSKIYAYAIQPFTDTQGIRRRAGQNLLSGTAYLTAVGKVRNAAVLRGDTSSPVAHTVTNLASIPKNDVFIQQFGGQVARISTPGSVPSPTLRVQRWREVQLW
jgi:hypothetical protein